MRAIVPLIDRVLAKYVESPETGCWNWIGALSLKRNGKRPVIQSAGRGSPVISVARYMCERRHGPAPTDLHEAGHTCPRGENDRCINPAHLEWMTRIENEAHKRTYVAS